ncbi:GntR family transcriptional regulator [Streptomyces orinoci]|uniref:GntR family transcriptional regulator n=1 Tax=Streptomyces orinoci TaxID=67339 RepID=A0ABV3K1G9_STRON|nr:GntR family transcriptional regulator [Streptomyces orinoci]
MPGSDAVKRTTLRSQIADALREEVIAGRLPAGRQFTVKEIAESYGVSATPVREALLDLCSQGLLDVELHKGYRVREFSYTDFLAMMEARRMMFEGMFRHAIERAVNGAGPEVLASVRRRADEAARAASAGELDVLIGYDLRFWGEFAALVGNPYVAGFLARVRVQSWVFMVPLLRRVPDLRGRLWRGHPEMVQALARRDSAEVMRLTLDYNDHALALIESLAGS